MSGGQHHGPSGRAKLFTSSHFSFLFSSTHFSSTHFSSPLPLPSLLTSSHLSSPLLLVSTRQSRPTPRIHPPQVERATKKAGAVQSDELAAEYEVQIAKLKKIYEDRIAKNNKKFERQMMEKVAIQEMQDVQLVLAEIVLSVVEECGGGMARSDIDTGTTSKDGVANSAPATPLDAWLCTAAEKQQVERERGQLDARLRDATTRSDQLSAALQESKVVRDRVKDDIKGWTAAFKEANGREPNRDEKAQILDKYQAYKKAANLSKELEEEARDSSAEKEDLERKLNVVDKKLAKACVTFEAAAGDGAGAGAEGELSGGSGENNPQKLSSASRGMTRQGSALFNASSSTSLLGANARLRMMVDTDDAECQVTCNVLYCTVV